MTEKYLKDKKLKSLSDKKKQGVVAEMLQVEVLGPVEQVWAAYSQAVASQHCAANFLCQVNERAKKEGTAR